MTLSSLLERLEKATGPDEALDSEIYWAIGEWINEGGWWRRHKVSGVRERYTYFPVPRYTESIDAAMSLVPEGWRVLRIEDMLLDRWDVELVEIHSRSNLPEGGSIYQHVESSARTLANAISAAALKARMSCEESAQ